MRYFISARDVLSGQISIALVLTRKISVLDLISLVVELLSKKPKSPVIDLAVGLPSIGYLFV